MDGGAFLLSFLGYKTDGEVLQRPQLGMVRLSAFEGHGCAGKGNSNIETWMPSCLM